MINKSPPFGQPNPRDRIDPGEFDQFRQFLEDACGISLGDNKQYLVTNRIRRILEENNLHSFGELVKVLKQGFNRKLREQVIDCMTTNETFWFRDIYPYEYLRNTLLPQLMVPNNRMFGPIRIWSAACSSGQEPYSISMMVEEYKRLQMGNLSRPVQVIATDLSSTVLEQARKGEYDRLSVIRGLTEDRLDRYFDKLSDNTWRVKSAIKERIEFRPMNLMDSYAVLGKFDIVFCRNVLIYFNAELKRQILQKIHASLRPGGILFLGSSEGLAGVADLFEMVRCEPGIVYRAI
ncbi:CheR family methyltransferase [Cellvibrio japonicus]|uniref:Chemotaxis protein methyltransferase n=1 Tax=Cellvibrio japonicus (strain Ueda107) TaxID=498211 RepID=B3PGT0_CELJU|nr:protein-glutamate O-methyltransferase CheR [Cellvibrio japonicus]ACE83898.1 chemotaxis protein methyltransferase CheR [Cellvibrio japonicus Ueda107]QEI12424.1 protein-glutamate O-methyltransferase CheR [Cellvibrio japonicus]QEI15997.1 protein-glutamate O-methyltransferase CheR [Cellvibrio japonicus]QEI19576.1 protein-glutamate O-methyltransferase CheR [Cellvibrio japonicus]